MSAKISSVIFYIKGASRRNVYGRLMINYANEARTHGKYDGPESKMFVVSIPGVYPKLSEQYESAKTILEDIFGVPVGIYRDHVLNS